MKNCTGLFQGKKRKELQAQSNKYAETIKIMKQGLSHIVQDYKYPTVDAFLQVYKQGKSEYESYVKANKEWNSKYGENSIHRKLAENRQKFRNGNRTEILTIVRHQTEELDNLIKFKKIKTIKFFIFLNIYEKSSCYLKCLIRFLIVSTIIRMITQKRNKTMWYSSSCFQFYKTAEIQC